MLEIISLIPKFPQTSNTFAKKIAQKEITCSKLKIKTDFFYKIVSSSLFVMLVKQLKMVKPYYFY